MILKYQKATANIATKLFDFILFLSLLTKILFY